MQVTSRARLTLVVIVVVMLVVGGGVYAYQAYPYTWPTTSVMAGEEYEVVLHSVRRLTERVTAFITVRWVGDGPLPYFGYSGQSVELQSGEELPSSLAVIRFNDHWLRLLNRSAIRVTFEAPGLSGPATIKLRFHLHGQSLECELPIEIPD